MKSKQDLRQSALILAIAFFLNATSDRFFIFQNFDTIYSIISQ
ncbi:hypothetical protein [Nostoc sp.]